MISRVEGTRVLRCYEPTKASDPSALAAAEDMAAGRAKRVPRLAVRSARESCIVVSFATAFGLQAQRNLAAEPDFDA